MKAAKWLLGKFPSPVFRRPMRPLSPEQLAAIRQGLQAIGFSCPVDPASAPLAVLQRRRPVGDRVAIV
jgi:hypothetical protein